MLPALAVLLSCEGSLPRVEDITHNKKPQYYILIAGEGIPVIPNSGSQIYPLNRSEAAAMERGATLAFQRSTALDKLRETASIVREDDRGRESKAIDIARKRQFDPLLLAVIGHSSSGSTSAALRYYEEAGIPVLMPIATSTLVHSSTGFRLPLNDQNGQAPALVDFITNDLQAEKVYIVKDMSQEAPRYTDPLTTFFVDRLPSDKFDGKDEVDSSKTDFANEARKIMANRADVVLFVGYASTAVLFLDALQEAYRNIPVKPRVVFTDGSISRDLNPGNMEVYLSAPFPEIRSDKCRGDEAGIFLGQLNQKLPNYEPFGYDAMLVLGDAVRQCRVEDDISRRCLVDRLRHGRFQGVCNDYVFEDGENQEGQYTVYSVKAENGVISYVVKKRYSVENLVKVSERLQNRG